jgi:DNA ligase 1
MLATGAELDKLRFPLLASAKLDGVRAIVQNGVVLSRSLKPIPNKFVQSALKHLEHLDGELIIGDPTSKTVYRDTVSLVMSIDKIPDDLRFYVFDHVQNPSERYQNRLVQVNRRSGQLMNSTSVVTHPQHVVTCLNTLLALEEKLLDQGYEGLILRDPDAPYKFGRSTVKEGYLLKLKRFVDDEATIVNCFEREHNGNEATKDELGRTKRSSHKAGKTGRGDLGGFEMRTTDGVDFSCGTGFTDDERALLWTIRDSLIGKVGKYKYFPVGVKAAPRHPVWLGFRDPIDTGD